MSGPVVTRFLGDLPRASRRLMMLDYDGTLAPLVRERGRAVPYPGVVSRLARVLAGDSRLVLVSGRGAAEVGELLGLEPAPEIWGCHGWERRPAGGSVRRRALPPAAARGLAAARALAVSAGAGGSLEVKSAAIALHWRGLPAAAAELAQRAAAAWEPFAAPSDALRLSLFDGGCELRVRGWDKGDVVRALLAEEGAGVTAAYLGDDETDEDAFRALRGRGLPLLVAAEPRPTSAEARLRPPAEVLEFLEGWAVAAAGGRSSP